jgi:ABC-type transport system involved in multi-copper enzyme maturation permease subunit
MIAAAFIPLGLALVSAVSLFAMTRLTKDFDVAHSAATIILSFVAPVASCLFAVGMVASDVKDGWLRTLLIRPISRQQYLLIKLAAVYTSIVLTILVAGVLPNFLVAGFFEKGEVRFALGPVLWIHGLALLQALLILSILSFFSCWLPGVFNVLLLAFWAMCASALNGYLQVAYWSNKWLMILGDLLFPSGFSSAADMISGGKGTPFPELGWGLGATGVILALAFWSISKIQVDKSSE